jgi:hypothetical protein
VLSYMFRRRHRRERILLPGESEGRRSFLKYGLAGAALLAVGGGTWLGTRRTRPSPGLAGPFTVLSPEEATVFLELSERLLPPRPGFPAPLDVDLPRRIDALLGLMPPEGQKEVRQLIGLFENALVGLLLDGQWKTFTDSTPEQQDARIRAWQTSRYRLRRTGYKALKKLVCAAYYGAAATWPAIGYPGPPALVSKAKVAEPAPEEAPRTPKAQRSRPAPAPRPVDEVTPAPRSGMDLPSEGKP